MPSDEDQRTETNSCGRSPVLIRPSLSPHLVKRYRRNADRSHPQTCRSSVPFVANPAPRSRVYAPPSNLALLGCLLLSIPLASAASPLDPAGFTANVAAALNAEPLPEPATVAGPSPSNFGPQGAPPRSASTTSITPVSPIRSLPNVDPALRNGHFNAVGRQARRDNPGKPPSRHPARGLRPQSPTASRRSYPVHPPRTSTRPGRTDLCRRSHNRPGREPIRLAIDPSHDRPGLRARDRQHGQRASSDRPGADASSLRRGGRIPRWHP